MPTRNTRWPFAFPVLLLGLAGPAGASFDLPAGASFDFWADDGRTLTHWEELPGDEDFAPASADAYVSSDASRFGQDGALVWMDFELLGPDGPRHGILLLDLDLARAPLDGETSMPPAAVRASYLEKRGDQVLFEGQAVAAEVWIVDVLFHEDDQGALELDFALLLRGAAPGSNGARALVRGRLVSEPSPARLRARYGYDPPADSGAATYVDIGCAGAVYASDDPDSGGGCDCDGDTSGEGGSDCEGGGEDSSDSCEGDAGGTASTSSSCEGDSGGGADCDCAGDAQAATRATRRARGPLPVLQRWLPQLGVLFGLVWLRRRHRRG
jgi:hypothetical protein